MPYPTNAAPARDNPIPSRIPPQGCVPTESDRESTKERSRHKSTCPPSLLEQGHDLFVGQVVEIAVVRCDGERHALLLDEAVGEGEVRCYEP